MLKSPRGKPLKVYLGDWMLLNGLKYILKWPQVGCQVQGRRSKRLDVNTWNVVEHLSNRENVP